MPPHMMMGAMQAGAMGTPHQQQALSGQVETGLVCFLCLSLLSLCLFVRLDVLWFD